MAGAAGEAEQRAHGLPLRVPCARRALVLLHHRVEHGGDESRRSLGDGDDEHGSDRIVLLRQRRRRPVVVSATFGGLRNLCLREQGDIARDLAEHSDHGSQRGSKLGDARAIGVPRQHRLGESETFGKPVRDVDAGVVQRSKRPRRAAQLRSQAFESDTREQGSRFVDRQQASPQP